MEPGENTLRLLVQSPEGQIFEGSGFMAVQINLPDGKIGIHPGHAPLVAEVAAGKIKMNDAQSSSEIFVQAGIMVVRNNLVQIFTHAQTQQVNEKIAAFTQPEDEVDRLVDAVMKTLTSITLENDPENDSAET
jgi:F0F1-type ATP synthase epsilon subunit